jgi:hypothetical protein
MDFIDIILSPQVLGAVASGFQTAGRINTGQQQMQHGEDLQAAAEFQAAQLEAQAGSAVAAAQRRAWTEERATRYLASETLARAAASGGGASDPTVINLIAKQAEEGSYRQQIALYEGEDRARVLRLQALARRYEGSSQKASAEGAGRASMLAAGTSLLSGMAKDSSMYQRFGGGGPQGIDTGAGVSPPNPFYGAEGGY